MTALNSVNNISVMNIELYKLTINMLQSKFENDKKLMSNSLTLVTLQFLEKS